MTELICNQGHVIDPGRNACARCGGHAIGMSETTPVINEVKAEATVEETVLDVESLNVKELKAELSLREVKFSAEDNKAKLQKKLKKALKEEAEADIDEVL